MTETSQCCYAVRRQSENTLIKKGQVSMTVLYPLEFLRNGEGSLTLSCRLQTGPVALLEVRKSTTGSANLLIINRVHQDGRTSWIHPPGERVTRREFPVFPLCETTLTLLAQTKVTFDNFLRAQAEGDPNSTAILVPLRLRYFSPQELLRLFGFCPDTGHFTWPAGVTTKGKYKLIGNSVNVDVVAELINYLFQ